LTQPQFKTVIDEHSDNITTALAAAGSKTARTTCQQCQTDLAACSGEHVSRRRAS
jgi:hypothetical protein